MLLLGLASWAWAFDVPAFAPDDAVQVSPASFDWVLGRVDEAAAEPGPPVWVVVYEAVADGTVGKDSVSETDDALAATWDLWVRDPRFDPQESALIVLAMDEREVRLKMGARWDSELGLHDDALLPIIDEGFMPSAQAGDLTGGLAGLVRATRAEIAERQASQARGRLAWRVGLGGLALAAVGLPIVAAGVALRRRRQSAGAVEARIRALLAVWREALGHAEERLADFALSDDVRDQMVALRSRGPRSQALLRDVTTRVMEIRAGVAGLSRHLREKEAQLANLGSFDQAGLEALEQSLDAPFRCDTGAPGDGLFDAPSRSIELSPQEVADLLSARWKQATEGWDRLGDAAEASLHRADQDLNREGYDQALAALTTRGISPTAVKGHPLWPDPAAAALRWEALRHEDPAAYLDELEAADQAFEATEARCEALVVDHDRAQAAVEVGPDLGALQVVFDHPSDDPAVSWRAAREAWARLQQELANDADEQRVEALAQQVVLAAEEARRLHQAALEAQRRAPAALEEATRAWEETRARQTDATTRTSALGADIGTGTAASAWQALREAGLEVDQIGPSIDRALRAQERGTWLTVLRLLADSQREIHEAQAALTALVDLLAQADGAPAKLAALEAGMAALRDECFTKIARLSQAPAPVLQPGDALYADWRAARSAGPVEDPLQLLRQLEAIAATWRRQTTAAELAWAEAERRRAAQIRAEQERDALLAGLAGYDPLTGAPIVDTSKGSGGGGLFSAVRRSGSSGSAGRAGRSRGSSRSAGGSFGGGSRSGGRSFGGGTRSGGRKF